jgi:hypothetical protein
MKTSAAASVRFAHMPQATDAILSTFVERHTNMNLVKLRSSRQICSNECGRTGVDVALQLWAYEQCSLASAHTCKGIHSFRLDLRCR